MKLQIKKILICSLLVMGVMASSSAQAQTLLSHKIINLLPIENGMAHISYSYNTESTFKEAPGEKLAYHVGDVGFQVPIPLTERFVIGAGAHYRLQNFRLINIPNYLPQNSITLHQIDMPLDAAFFLGDRWFLDFNFSPSLNTDFKSSIGSRDIQYNGGILAGVALSDITAFYFGVGFGKDFTIYLPFPLLGLVVKPHDSFFDMEIFMPMYLRLNFKVAKPITLFLAGDFNGIVWNVHANGGVPQHFVRFMDTQLGAGAKFKLARGLLLEVMGGINPWREVKLRDNTGAELTRRLKVGFYAETQITITPDIFKYFNTPIKGTRHKGR